MINQGTAPDLKKMNIVHINVEEAFMKNSSYQETLLAKSHKLLCNNVTIINSNRLLHDNGTITIENNNTYYNKDHVKIITIPLYNQNQKRRIDVRGLYHILVQEMPDFIMVHGVFSFDVLAVAKYIKKTKHDCIVVADSHATRDNANIMKNTPKNILFRNLLKLLNKYMSRYYRRIYGIVEDAVDLMVTYAGVPKSKTAILDLGYDETIYDFAHQAEIRNAVRQKYNIPQNIYLLVHGGKLDQKKKTLEFISTLRDLPKNTHAVIFGNFNDDSYKEDVLKESTPYAERVHFTGALSQEEITDLYLASDAAVFPGTASCLRQQAVAAGLPIIIGYNTADSNINITFHNNAVCLPQTWTEKDLASAINEIYSNPIYKESAAALCQKEYKKYSYLYQAESLIRDNI